jgi:hypothetical protein
MVLQQFSAQTDQQFPSYGIFKFGKNLKMNLLKMTQMKNIKVGNICKSSHFEYPKFNWLPFLNSLS